MIKCFLHKDFDMSVSAMYTGEDSDLYHSSQFGMNQFSSCSVLAVFLVSDFA